MMSRRKFIQQSGQAIAGLTVLPGFSSLSAGINDQQLSISLAQWSLHRSFEKGTLDPSNFASIASKDYGISAVEYVNGFYLKHSTDEAFWQQMNQKALDHDVTNLLIMVDSEGDLGNPSDKKRNTAVENHYKWIHAAKLMNCHSIRVNAFGQGSRKDLRNALIDGLGKLTAYAAQQNINVLIENHGLHTSDAPFIKEIIEQVSSPYLGTLPDFGNWCTSVEWGSIQNDTCKSPFDLYDGVQTFLPYAKGVSAKSYDFDANGNETRIDYRRMIQLVKQAGFSGHIGIEYEGNQLSEPDGIRATYALLKKLI